MNLWPIICKLRLYHWATSHHWSPSVYYFYIDKTNYHRSLTINSLWFKSTEHTFSLSQKVRNLSTVACVLYVHRKCDKNCSMYIYTNINKSILTVKIKKWTSCPFLDFDRPLSVPLFSPALLPCHFTYSFTLFIYLLFKSFSSKWFHWFHMHQHAPLSQVTGAGAPSPH